MTEKQKISEDVNKFIAKMFIKYPKRKINFEIK